MAANLSSKQFKLEMITWRDHWTDAGPIRDKEDWIAEAQEDFVVMTCGFVLYEDKRQVLLVNEYHSTTDTYKFAHSIMKNAIIRREKIK